MKLVIGFVIAFAVGAACRWFDLPVPAPPKLIGAMLVLTTTVGYMATDSMLNRRQSNPTASAASTASRTNDIHPPGR